MLREFKDTAVDDNQTVAGDFGMADVEVRGSVLYAQQQQQGGYPSCPHKMASIIAQQQAQI